MELEHQTIELEWNGVSRVTLTVIVDERVSLKKVLRFLGYQWEFAYKNRDNIKKRSFVDSGLMDITGTVNECELTVDVGCYCSFDCCGHMCSMAHQILKIRGYWHIYTYKSYNR